MKTEHEKDMLDFEKLKHGGRNSIKYSKLAFIEYGFKKICNRCGKDNDICIHHIDENFLNNNKENFEILCRSCHSIHHMKGKNNTIEQNKKISENNGNKGKFGAKNHTSKKVNQLNIQGDILKTFGSILEAERQTGVNNGNISKACKKGTKAGGYYWKYFIN